MSALKPIKCRAAVMYDYEQPLVLEDVIIDAPKDDQVRVKMISAGICLSEITVLEGKYKFASAGEHDFPIVLGHEGAGIVESVGEKVTSLKPGDHVLTSYILQCNDCAYCSSPLTTNICAKKGVSTLMPIPNKKLATGKDLQSYAALGTFSEYILVKSIQLERIDSSIALEHLSAITCATGSGFGAAKYLAKIVPGTSVAVFGSGAFGLNAMLGAKCNGAKHIIAIDVHNDRKQLASEFGCTEFINPNELDNRPVSQYLMDKYGGVDYAFDCNGEPSNVPNGLNSLAPFGTFTFVALTHSATEVVYPTKRFAVGKKLVGGFFGNRSSKDMYQEVLDMYQSGQYQLDKMITFKYKLDQINEALQGVASGKSVKTLIVFD